MPIGAEIPENLYKQIIKVLPIACVDLFITDPLGNLLLLTRKNEPAKGQWWFPGGRVGFGETRRDAVVRKLKEECGIEKISVAEIEEVKSFDLILQIPGEEISHGITTLFMVQLRDKTTVRIDSQSLKAEWRSVGDWELVEIHPTMREMIRCCLLPGVEY